MSESATQTIEMPNAILIEEVRRLIQEGRSVTMRVKGNSMRLFLGNNRDDVRLEAIAPEAIRRFDVVLAEVSPKFYVIHRVIRREGDMLILKGDGNLYQTERCQATDVIGVVTAFYRKGRIRPDLASGLKWRLYSRLWLLLSPLRRVILGVARRLDPTYPHQ